MATINPYLNFSGNTEEAFNFYKSVFGGEFLTLQRFKDFPEGYKLSPADREKIMHVSLPISNGYILIGTDTVESEGQVTVKDNNYYISVQTESKEEADRVFNDLSSGGKIERKLRDTIWGAYFGILTDKFGIRWMVSYEYPKENS